MAIAISPFLRQVLWETERPSVGTVNPSGEAEKLGICSGSVPWEEMFFSFFVVSRRTTKDFSKLPAGIFFCNQTRS